jgi:hypothetical protein
MPQQLEVSTLWLEPSFGVEHYWCGSFSRPRRRERLIGSVKKHRPLLRARQPSKALFSVGRSTTQILDSPGDSLQYTNLIHEIDTFAMLRVLYVLVERSEGSR